MSRASSAGTSTAGADPGLAAGERRVYLRISRLDKSFGSFCALRDVSLEVGEGEFVCFLGPSGCGKTTLLRAIAGLDPQSSGRIEQAGRDISRLPVTQRDFGIVFQSYALFPNLTVHRNVAYGLESRGLGKAGIRTRVAELLELAGLPEEADKYPAQLSGGQQQRVALCRALAPSPGLLLLDEPLSALDARVRLHLRREIRQLHNRLGLTTILVTHDQEEALTIADRIVVMRQGVIEQVGTPVEVYREPATPFVADFVGTMNFLPGVLCGAHRVRLGSVELECRAVTAELEPGDPVTVAVRPEDVAVRGVRAETPNAFEARITAMEFLGSFHRATLSAGALDEAPLTADFSVNVVRDLDLARRRRIPVALPAERIRVFPSPAGGTRS